MSKKKNNDRINYLLDTISKEDLKIFYWDDGHFVNEVLQHFSITKREFALLRDLYDLKKPQSKRMQDTIKRFGKSYVCNPSATKNTMLERYGFDSYMKTEDFKEKSKITNIEKFGAEYALSSSDVRQKCIDTLIKRYGVDNPQKNLDIVAKTKKTNNERYGGNSPTSSRDVRLKQHESRKLNKDSKANSSKKENEIFNKLLSYFSEDDIVRWYEGDYRYPYECDFYIKSLDLFIEYNGFWTHGGHLFDKNNEDDVKKLNMWLDKLNSEDNKISKYYEGAIKTWTINDISKYNTAINNNLNYLIIYDKEVYTNGNVPTELVRRWI